MDINYINVKFESNGKILEVGKGKPYRLLSIDGIDSADFEITSEKNILSDGSSVRNKRVTARPIMAEIEYVGSDKEKKRTEVSGFFNIHREGILSIDYQGIKRSIEYIPESYKAKIGNLYEPYKFLVSLYCPNPYLLEQIEISEEIITWIGGLSFPLRLPTTFAIAGEKIINVVNDGDVETPVTIEIFGPAINPKIVKRETGEYIRIKKELTSDDRVVITTNFGNKRVELNGANAFNLLDLPASTFFNLDVGDNVISLVTEDVSSNANVKISYRNRYLGV